MTLTVTPAGQVVRAVIWGEPVYFTITNPRDSIQKIHHQGQFYEPEELEIIRKWCPPGAVFADIGANIGNHSLFALKFLRVAKVICFEPNPAAISILHSNLGLNGVLDRCDLRHLGVGLSDEASSGFGIVATRRNLGGGQMVADGGELTVARGDDLLADEPVSFIKIDVEGMETRVLAGLSAVIAARHPTIFVEVDNTNRAAFLDWVAAQGYEVRARYRRYKTNENFLITPKSPRRGAEA